MPKETLSRDRLIAQLEAAIGAPYVLHRRAELMLYEYDASALDLAVPDIVVVPNSTAEVAARGCRAGRCRRPEAWSFRWRA